MNYLEYYASKFKTPVLSSKEDDVLRFTFFIPGESALTLLIRSDDGTIEYDIPMLKSGNTYTCEASLSCKGLYFYSVSNKYNQFLDYTEDGKPFFSRKHVSAQHIVVSRDYIPAEEFYGGIAYQIFPDRFAVDGETVHLPRRVYHKDLADIPYWRPDSEGKIRNNDFYGGNIRGIISRLDYLASLGVTLIYLNPIFEAASNHRYDTGNYLKIDPQLGTEDDFRELCAEARSRGIRIILDGVFSHTGDDSIYFNRYGHYGSEGAYQSRKSPYFQWYKFCRWPDQYDSWWGIDTLPEVDETEPSYRAFITGEGGVIDHWMQAGASGFRLDVADELPDSFIAEVRDAIRRNDPEGLLIGEVWEDASNKISYSERRKYFWGDELDGCMNYPFKNAVLDYMRTGNAECFEKTVSEIILHYPAQMLHSCLNMLSSHDTERAINALAAPESVKCSREQQSSMILCRGDYMRGVEMLKLAYALMFFLPGIPMIYYGDEIGLQGGKDPFCRGFFCEDKADRNLLDSIHAICSRRTELRDILKDADTEFFRADSGCIGFRRISEKGKLAFMINMGNECSEFDTGTCSFNVKPWTYRVELI